MVVVVVVVQTSKDTYQRVPNAFTTYYTLDCNSYLISGQSQVMISQTQGFEGGSLTRGLAE